MSLDRNEEVTTTLGTLKDVQNEAFQDGIRFAQSQINYFLPQSEDSLKIIQFLDLIANTKLYDDGLDECTCEEDCGAEGCECDA